MTSKTDYTNLLDMSAKYARKLDGQRVLVIGGSTGIGFAVAEAALEHGANVIISSSNQSKIDSAIERLKIHMNKNQVPVRKMFSKVCNLANPETIEANVKELLESASQDGKLDHVVFTAGDFNPPPSLDSATVSVISEIGMVRVMGAVFVAKHLSSYINQSNNSSFTITGTTTDSRPAGAGWSVLKAAVGGIEPMTRALCIDLKPVRVNCVTPGFVHTALFDGFPKDVRDVIFPAMEKDSVPGSWCALWVGSFTGTSGGESAWSWYDMDCFCDESSSATSGLATGTTATEATNSETTTTSVELTSTTEAAPATTTTTGAELTYSCPGGFPADSLCEIKLNHIGGSVGRIVGELAGEPAVSLDNCVKACVANKDCDFFAYWPDQFCELWEGTYEPNESAAVPWNWYELSCFCVPGSEATTTEATTTGAVTTEATTTTEAATTTTTAPGESCVNNEKLPAPSDKVCNKDGYWTGTSIVLAPDGLPRNSMESCRAACRDTSGCAYFAITPGQTCWIYGGDIEGVTDQPTDYIWYEMDCFCDLDEPDY
ncbi:verA-like protein [Fusarium bulbicola]|nr:verA-like protein [Fusarium bulbicola]